MTDVGGVHVEQLRAFVERAERLNEELANLNNDKKEVFAEARSAGYNVPILKRIISMRKMDEADRTETEEITGLYKQALGM